MALRVGDVTNVLLEWLQYIVVTIPLLTEVSFCAQSGGK
jgi:hypothetical protein